MMDIEADEILLHYEELGDIDVKITVTLNLVAEYYIVSQCVDMTTARRLAIELREASDTWSEAVDPDEAFYVFCKRKFFQKAMDVARGRKSFVVCFFGKDGKVETKEYRSFKSAVNQFSALNIQDKQAAIYVKREGFGYHTNPIRKCNKPVELIAAMEKEIGLEQANTEVQKCRKQREVKRCKDCLRYEFCDLADRTK